MAGSFYENCFDNILYQLVFGHDRLMRLTSKCPSKGGFVGYKKCLYWDKFFDGYSCCIVTLWIPPEAHRLGGTRYSEGKCRASEAKVVGLETIEGVALPKGTIARSFWKPSLRYEVGHWVYPDSFNENPYETCSNGIHFFMAREEAVNYL